MFLVNWPTDVGTELHNDEDLETIISFKSTVLYQNNLKYKALYSELLLVVAFNNHNL